MDLTQLKKLRKDKKITISDLSKKTGVSRNVITSMENGKGNPSFASVLAVVNGLGYEIRILVP